MRAEAARRGVTYVSLGPALGLESAQVYRKMRGKVAFSIDELGVLAAELSKAGKFPRLHAWEFFPDAPRSTLHAVA